MMIWYDLIIHMADDMEDHKRMLVKQVIKLVPFCGTLLAHVGLVLP